MSLPNPKTKKISDPAGTAGKGQGKELKPTTPLPGPNDKSGPLPQAINPVRPRGMPSPLPRDVGTGAGPRGSVGGVKGPLPQAVDPVRPRGMPSPLPRDVGVGGGPRTAPIVNQPIKPVRDIGTGAGPRGPVGGVKGPVVQGINTGGPKPAPISQQTVGPNADVANGVKFNPMANATGPMTPTLGGGMAPASVATMMKKGGKVKSKSSYSSGGGVKSSASKRGDGCAQRGKTKGRMV